MNSELLEELAGLEHEQWVFWTKELAQKHANNKSWKPQIEKWKKYWVSSQELPEEIQEADRIWARKVINILISHLREQL